MARILSAHNAKILRNDEPHQDPPCNCRNKDECPMDGKCNYRNVIYQATITPLPPIPTPGQDDPPQNEIEAPRIHTYIGLTASKFKERYANHKKSIKHKKYSKETTLSKKIWEIKEKGLEYELKWKILDRAQPFSPVVGICGLCTQEKWYILFKPELSTLNKREEILGHCFHKEQALLINS